MNRSAITILIFFGIIFSSSVTYAFFDSQNFELPLESKTVYGYLVNDRFHNVTSSVLGGNLFKGGIFLALLIAIIKFGFGEKKSLLSFAEYMLIMILLVAPLFQGKCMVIATADALDRTILAIVQKIGGLDPKRAGGGVGVYSAIQFAETESIKAGKSGLVDIKRCNEMARKDFKDRNPGQPLPSDVLSPEFRAFYEVNQAPPNSLTPETCGQLIERTKREMTVAYKKALNDYASTLESNRIELTGNREIVNRLNASELPDLITHGVSSPIVERAEEKANKGFWGFFRDLCRGPEKIPT